MGIKHSKISAVQTSGDPSLVGPADWNADHAISGTLDLTGASSILGVPLQFSGVPTGACSAFQMAVDNTTGNFYSCNVGAWLKVGPGGLVNPVTGFNPLNFDLDIGFKGPNPYVDVRRFGARAVNPNTTPAATGLTANCTATQTSVTISSASTFVNGDGVILYGCGAPHSMTAPTGVTVTPSLAIAGTESLNDTPSAAGSTTYNYKVIARDRNGGLTAASSVTSTTTGQASLGAVNVNITSMSRSGQTVTVVTSAAHSILVGCGVTNCGEVFIGGGNGLTDSTFRGWYTITSAADTTHFTFISGPSTTLGATTSATGGIATVYNLNKVCWSAVTGAVQYYLLSDRANPGTYAVIDGSIPNSATGIQDLCLEDYGSPFMDNQIFPPFITAAAPWSSATSDHLSTTIASGAGTTTLTLANAAGTTVSGATIRLDIAPAIQAAITYQQANGGFIHFPATANANTCFVLNSWLQVSVPNNPGLPFHQSGCLFLNDTLEFAASGSGGVKYYGDILPTSQGGVPAASWGSYPLVSVNSATPGLWFSNPTQHSLQVRGLQLTAGATNGGILMVAEGGFDQHFEHINFIGGSAGNDFASKGLILKAGPGQANSNVVLNFIGFAPGGGTDGVSHTPTLQCRGCGTVSIPNSYSVHRGMLFTGASGPIIGVGGIAYINGGGTPLVTVSPTGTGGGIVIGSVVLDTIAHPCVTSLQNAAGGGIDIVFLYGSCVGSSGVPGVSGQYRSLRGVTQGLYSSYFNASGQIEGSVSDSILGFQGNYPQQLFNTSFALGQQFGAFVQGAAPVITSCPVSAGGSLPVATHTFQLVPLWWNGNQGQFSTVCSATTTTGNQTVTLNYNSYAGNPQLLRIYDGSGNRLTNITASPTAGSVVISSETIAGGTPDAFPSGGPTMLLPGVQGIASGGPIIVANTTFANLGAVAAAGTFKYCSDCTTAATCAGSGSGHMATSNGTAWTCQ